MSQKKSILIGIQKQVLKIKGINICMFSFLPVIWMREAAMVAPVFLYNNNFKGAFFINICIIPLTISFYGIDKILMPFLTILFSIFIRFILCLFYNPHLQDGTIINWKYHKSFFEDNLMSIHTPCC